MARNGQFGWLAKSAGLRRNPQQRAGAAAIRQEKTQLELEFHREMGGTKCASCAGGVAPLLVLLTHRAARRGGADGGHGNGACCQFASAGDLGFAPLLKVDTEPLGRSTCMPGCIATTLAFGAAAWAAATNCPVGSEATPIISWNFS